MGAFSDSVNPRSFKVLTQPDYIFLCGGKLDDLEHSLRAHFYKDKVKPDSDLLKRVRLAEDADKWYQTHKVFADLLELEEHLAGLSACILLFVESPGAIAEFGAFSQMKLLQDKLVVVIESGHFSQTSFIRYGLVEHAQRLRPESVLTYPWLSTSAHGGSATVDLALAPDTLDRVAEEVQRLLKAKPRTTSFRNKDHGHLMLLLADLIALNVVMLQHELRETLRSLGISIKLAELKKYLFLLGQLQLIRTFTYGRVEYLMNPSGGSPYVDYAPKTPADRTRLRALLRNDFPLTPEKSKAFSAFKRRSGGGMP